MSGCLLGQLQKGIGTYRNSAGSVYTGPFSEGKFEGKGQMISATVMFTKEISNAAR